MGSTLAYLQKCPLELGLSEERLSSPSNSKILIETFFCVIYKRNVWMWNRSFSPTDRLSFVPVGEDENVLNHYLLEFSSEGLQNPLCWREVGVVPEWSGNDLLIKCLVIRIPCVPACFFAAVTDSVSTL